MSAPSRGYTALMLKLGKSVASSAAGGGIGLGLWVLEMAEIKLPPFLLWILGLLALAMVIYGISPWLVTLWRRGSQIHFRSPFFLVTATQRPETTPEALAVLADGWIFRRSNDGARVLVEHRGVYKIMEADAYAYFEKLRDIEKQRVIDKWRRLRVVYWPKHKMTRDLPGVYEVVPVYFDPEGIAWRKDDIASQPEPAKIRLQRDRPDVWGFFIGESPEVYEKKYPGKLPYER